MSVAIKMLILAEQLEVLLPRQRKADSYIRPLLKFMTDKWKAAKLEIVQVILTSAWEGRQERVLQRLFDAEDALPNGLLAESDLAMRSSVLIFDEAVTYGKSGLGTARSVKGNPIRLYFDIMTTNDLADMKALWGDKAIYLNEIADSLTKPSLRAMVVKDASGNIHGAMVYEKAQENVYLHFVETAPFNRGVQGHSGIGSNLLARAAADVGPGGTMRLQATVDSVGYYEKIGMQKAGYVFQFTEANAKSFADEVGVSRSSRGRIINPNSIDLTNDKDVIEEISARAGKVTEDYGKVVKAEIGSIRAAAKSDSLPKLVRGTRNRTTIILNREGLQEVIDNLAWQENFVDDLALSTKERVARLLNARYGDFSALEAKVRKTFRIDRDDLLQAFHEAVDKHAKDVIANKITPATFEARMQRTISQHYPKLYRAGSGRSLTTVERAYVQRQSVSQAQYLANFRQYMETQQLIGNELTGRISQRAGLYAERGSALYEQGYVNSQPSNALYDWLLQPAEHCNTCPIFASNSPYTRDTLPGMPGEGFHLTECGTNCKCIIELSPLYVTPEGIAESEAGSVVAQ